MFYDLSPVEIYRTIEKFNFGKAFDDFEIFVPPRVLKIERYF